MYDYETSGALVRRVTLSKTDDSQDAQYRNVEGLMDETFEKVMHIQQHGFSSHPPNGSHAIGLALGGRTDLMVTLGGESPEKRPTDLAEGDCQLYNAKGTNLHLKDADATMDGEGTLTVTFAKKVKFVCGGTSITLTPAGIVLQGDVQINGGRVVHNSSDIGDLHKHAGGPIPDVTGKALSDG